MMFDKNFVPEKPFDNYKWIWAAKTPTESINDPLVLLGVLFRLYDLSKKHVKFSSEEYAKAMQTLKKDLQSANIGAKVAERTGKRNLIRNSGQYWKALGLIPQKRTGGWITLTEFGKAVAERRISKTEFSAITVQTYALPNEKIQSAKDCSYWNQKNIKIWPLKIILSTLHELKDYEINGEQQGWISPIELIKIIIPLSAYKVQSKDYANFIYWYRKKEININAWPNCVPGKNDKRLAREYLLFLENYGYVSACEIKSKKKQYEQRFFYNADIDDEIMEILNVSQSELVDYENMKNACIVNAVQNMERKKYNRNKSRPYQAQFRRDLLAVSDRCLITRVRMTGLLEAAHIKPHKYNGPEEKENGILLRRDIHYLFDSGNLRIDADGNVEISQAALEDYGRVIPERIVIPDYVDKEYLRWRWENYDGE